MKDESKTDVVVTTYDALKSGTSSHSTIRMYVCIYNVYRLHG